MAILRNSLPDNIRGHIDKQIVVKHRFGKTIITAYPDMSKVRYNENQKTEQRRFGDAVAYAQSIISDPEKKAQYKARLPKGKKVFNAAIADDLSGRNVTGFRFAYPTLKCPFYRT